VYVNRRRGGKFIEQLSDYQLYVKEPGTNFDTIFSNYKLIKYYKEGDGVAQSI